MDSYLFKYKSVFKLLAALSVLICALIFASPANAASREVNPTTPTATPVQVAYWGGYHRHWRGYGWHRYHRWHHWNRWHHWRR